MSEITYDELRPLIAAQDLQGSRVHVTFRCPKSGATFPATASVRQGRGVGDVALAAAKQTMWRTLRSGLMSAMRGVLGGGAVGSIGRQVGNSVMRDMTQGTKYSGSDVETAVVQAFASVQSNFRREGQGWVAAHGQVAQTAVDTGFHQQLRSAPVTEQYDKGVLARLMVEVARGDGDLSSEEQGFLSEFLDPSLGTIDQLSTRPPLSPVELAETSQAARETILMLGWALALSDQQLAASETARLTQVQEGLGIPATRSEELKGYAQTFLVDQALAGAYSTGSRDSSAHSEAMKIASSLGLSPEAAERADVLFRKARGIL